MLRVLWCEQSMARAWVSLGGWCGPSQILAKLGKANGVDGPLPFDLVRCTMDGVVQFAAHGFDGFFPPRVSTASLGSLIAPRGKFPMDPVSIWLLFRGVHTAFTHYDLNDPRVVSGFHERFRRWKTMTSRPGNVTFLRTNIAKDPNKELSCASKLLAALDASSKRQLDSRIVIAVHGSFPATRPRQTIHCPAGRCRGVVWELAYDITTTSPTASLFDRTQRGYETIVAGSEDAEWSRTVAIATERMRANDLPPLPQSEHLSKIEGVPTFRGTCTGFGSTLSAALGGNCFACGDHTGHAMQDPKSFDSPSPWSSEDDDVVIQLAAGSLASGSPMDLVALVEAVANARGRGAHETLQRVHQLLPEYFT